MHCLSHLVNYVTFVLFLEYVLPNQCVQIDVHKLEHEINVSFVLGFDYFLQRDYVRVLDFVEEHHLAVGALGVCWVLEGIEIFFQGVDSFVFFVDNFPHDSVGSAAYFFDNLESLEDVWFDFIVIFAHLDRIILFLAQIEIYLLLIE